MPTIDKDINHHKAKKDIKEVLLILKKMHTDQKFGKPKIWMACTICTFLDNWMLWFS